MVSPSLIPTTSPENSFSLETKSDGGLWVGVQAPNGINPKRNRNFKAYPSFTHELVLDFFAFGELLDGALWHVIAPLFAHFPP
jgi:hypothetical protein